QYASAACTSFHRHVILAHNLIDRHPARQPARDHRDGHARAPDHRPSVAHRRVDADAFAPAHVANLRPDCTPPLTPRGATDSAPRPYPDSPLPDPCSPLPDPCSPIPVPRSQIPVRRSPIPTPCQIPPKPPNPPPILANSQETKQ